MLYGADGERVQKAKGSEVTVSDGFVTAAEGYTILTPKEINDAYEQISTLTLSVSDTSAIKVQGVRAAFEGTKQMVYDEGADTITNTATGEVYTVQKVGVSDRFVNADGQSLPQSWKQNVGLANYERLFTSGSISAEFFKAFVWTVTFAFFSVFLTFIVGFFLALV